MPAPQESSSVQAALEKVKQSQIMGDEGDDLTPPDDDDGMILSGHPAMDDGDGEGTGDDDDAGEKGGKQGAPPAGEEDKPPPKKDEPKYKDLEAANKAATEAAKKMHKATEEAAQLRKDIEQLQATNLELQQKFLERATELSEEENEAILEKALKDMRELDPTDENYEKSMAKLWRKVFGHSEKSLLNVLKAAAKEVFSEEHQAKTQEQREAEARYARWEKGNRIAAEAGLEMEDEEILDNGTIIRSPDYVRFWELVNKAAPEDLSDDEKFSWAAKKMVGNRKASAGKKAAKADEVRNFQEKRMPLGRGAQGPVGGKVPDDTPKAPRTLNEALDRARDRRRI